MSEIIEVDPRIIDKITCLRERISQLEAALERQKHCEQAIIESHGEWVKRAEIAEAVLQSREKAIEQAARQIADDAFALREAGKAIEGLLLRHNGQWWAKCNPTEEEVDAAGKVIDAAREAIAKEPK